MNDRKSLYQKMLLIRRFEEMVLDAFSSGILTGTTHTYIGQEANAVGVFSAVQMEDVIFSNHRCHGHFLAYGGDPYLLFAELMGRVTGLVGGRGGSQHIHWRNFYTNGIQGGIVPVAAGMALAEKHKQGGNIVLAFIGDGTLGEGVIYETVNIASLWRLPLLIILENNRYAQTTPLHLGVAGSMPARFRAFDWKTWEIETADVLDICTIARDAVEYVRTQQSPACLLLHTYRFMAHSKGDDLRTAEELASIRAFDPLSILAPSIPADVLSLIEKEVGQLLVDALTRAGSDPFPSLSAEEL